MGDLQQIKQRFVVVLAVLAVIDLVLLVYLFWPGSSSLAQQAQLETVQQKNTNLTRDVGYAPGVILPSSLAALGLVEGLRPTLMLKVDAGRAAGKD